MTHHTREDAINQRMFDTLAQASYDNLSHPFDIQCRFVLYAGGRLGMRAGEIAHFSEEWVDWDKEIIQIPSHDPCTKGRDGGLCGYCRVRARKRAKNNEDVTLEQALAERWQPKTENSARAIPFDFDEDVRESVMEMTMTYDEYPASRASINRRVNRLLEAADYPTSMCYPHALRATAATTHAYRGLTALPLMALMGWADLQTARKYIKAAGGATQQALRKVHSDD
jgi:integrase